MLEGCLKVCMIMGISYIVYTGPNILGDECSLICGMYGDIGERKELFPNAGEFWDELCERSGDGIRLFVYSGSVLGSRSGEAFCDMTYGLLWLLDDLSLLALDFESLLA